MAFCLASGEKKKRIKKPRFHDGSRAMLGEVMREAAVTFHHGMQAIYQS